MRCMKMSIYMIKIKPGGVCRGPGGSPHRHRGAGKKIFEKNKARQAGLSCLQ